MSGTFPRTQFSRVVLNPVMALHLNTRAAAVCLGGASLKLTSRHRQLGRLQPWRKLARVSSRNSLSVRSVLQEPASRPQESSFQPSILFEEPLLQVSVSEADPALSGNSWKIIPDIWDTLAQECPDSVALFDPHRPNQPQLTFQELHDQILWFSEGLKALGLQRGECVSLLSENSYRWLIADQGVMKCGACDAVRGARSSPKELQYIVAHADSAGLIVESEEVLEKVRLLLEDEGKCPPLKFVVALWPTSDVISSSNGTSPVAVHQAGLRFPVLGFNDVIEAGKARLAELGCISGNEAPAREDDIATMVFTSGTTGEPKAVMLTHANLMHQVKAFRKVLHFGRGDVLLSLLPPWHMYERSCEYFALSRGTKQIYSSVKTFKEDLTQYPPDFFVAVPLVFDVLYNGVQRKLSAASATRTAIAKFFIGASLAFMEALRAWQGMALPRPHAHGVDSSSKEPVHADSLKMRGMFDVVVAGIMALLLLPFHLLASKLVFGKVRTAIPIRKVAVSGGGSLAPHIDKFFEAMGLTLLNGYGLTETSPVLAVRVPNHNVLGTVGTPISETQIKVVDADSGATLPDGVRGIVKGKGPQIMKGYYKNPAATAAVIDADGWFDTGDIGWITPELSYGPSRNSGRQLVLEGRAKDTIVLASGENVEPAWVEEAALRSPAISQIMVIGQDQRRLAALIVPSKEEVEKIAQKKRKKKGVHHHVARESTSSTDAIADAGVESEVVPVTDEERRSIIREELNRCLAEAGCGKTEKVGPFSLLEEPFSIENGTLTATMKMKRDVIYNKYEDLCNSLYEA